MQFWKDERNRGVHTIKSHIDDIWIGDLGKDGRIGNDKKAKGSTETGRNNLEQQETASN